MVLKSPAAFEVNNHTVLARKLSIPLLFSVCMYLHSLTQPCDVNNFWSLPYNTVQKCAKCSSIYILSGYKVWLCSDFKGWELCPNFQPHIIPLYGLFGWPGQSLCALWLGLCHWLQLVDTKYFAPKTCCNKYETKHNSAPKFQYNFQ